MFWEGKVFMCFLLSSTTESAQPTDCGHRRQLRHTPGDLLDKRLTEEDNIKRWERKMTVSERRFLVNNLVAKANCIVLKKYNMRVDFLCRPVTC